MKLVKGLLLIPILSVWIGGGLVAQEPGPDLPEVEIPFIDRDGDGINDLLQTGWGLRFMDRYKKRQLVWEQLEIEVVKGEKGEMVDTDGDGVGDVDLKQFLQNKMNEMIDTDGDGVPDTALKEYMGRKFRAFDADGDGLPDEISKNQLRQRNQQMKAWRKEIRDRIRQGLPAFEDADQDGIPDNLPEGLGRKGRKGKRGG